MRRGRDQDLHTESPLKGRSVSSRGVKVAWVIASLASRVERVGGCGGSSLPRARVPSPMGGRVNSSPGDAGCSGGRLCHCDSPVWEPGVHDLESWRYHSRKKYHMQSVFSQQLISYCSYSRGGGAELFPITVTAAVAARNYFPISGYSRGRGTERP